MKVYETPVMIKVEISSTDVFAQYSSSCPPSVTDVDGDSNGACDNVIIDKPWGDNYLCYDVMNP